MYEKNNVSNIISNKTYDIKQKKSFLHHYFDHIYLLGKFDPSSTIYRAMEDYKIALLNEIDFLDPEDTHALECVYLLGDILQSTKEKNLHSFFKNFEKFIKESKNTRFYPRIKMALISIGIAIFSMGILALSLWVFTPPGILFLTAVLVTTLIAFFAITITNYILSEKIYKPIFESEEKADKLCQVIERTNLGLRYYFFTERMQELKYQEVHSDGLTFDIY